jgi:hypothetical protein
MTVACSDCVISPCNACKASQEQLRVGSVCHGFLTVLSSPADHTVPTLEVNDTNAAADIMVPSLHNMFNEEEPSLVPDGLKVRPPSVAKQGHGLIAWACVSAGIP